MASCQTWAPTSHIRHPWFDAAVMKRKHRDTEPDADDDAYPSSPPPTPASTPVSAASVPGSASATNATTVNPTTPGRAPPAKRRRCSTLENGLAHLSLGGSGGSAPPLPSSVTTAHSYSKPTHNAYPRVQEVPAPQPILATLTPHETERFGGMIASEASSGRSSPMAVDSEMLAPLPPPPPRPHTYTVEEAEEEEARAPEVKMGVVSWYEPEPDRIVITDLDSFTEEVEEEEAEAAREKLSINEALLARIRRQRAADSTSSISSPSSSGPSSTPPSTSTSQALVLFRPLPLSDTERDKVNTEQEKQRRRAAAETERKWKEKEAQEEEEQRRRFIEARDEDAMMMDVEP